jgi:hypothetical protein
VTSLRCVKNIEVALSGFDTGCVSLRQVQGEKFPMSAKPQKEAWAKHAHTVYVQAHAGEKGSEEERAICEADIPRDEHGAFTAEDVASLIASVREQSPSRAAHEAAMVAQLAESEAAAAAAMAGMVVTARAERERQRAEEAAAAAAAAAPLPQEEVGTS